MAQGSLFPGLNSGMFSRMFPQGVHPAFQGQAQPQAQQAQPQGGGAAFLGKLNQPQGGFVPQGGYGWVPSGAADGSFKPIGTIPGGANDYWNWLAGNNAPSAGGQIDTMMAHAGQAGVFDPFGSSPLVNMLQNIYQGQAAGQNRGALEMARNNMVDPSGYGYASMMSQLLGQGRMADALANARYQSAMHNQDWLRQNVGGAYLNNLSNYLNSQTGYSVQAKLNADQQNAQKHMGMGGFIGSALGAVGGAIPGVSSLTSMFGGGSGLPTASLDYLMQNPDYSGLSGQTQPRY